MKTVLAIIGKIICYFKGHDFLPCVYTDKLNNEEIPLDFYMCSRCEKINDK